MEKQLTVKEVAVILNVCRRTVFRLPIRYSVVGTGRGTRRYDPKDVQAYLDRRASRKRAA